VLAATAEATRRLPANGAPGQTHFAHVVSTNYSQYKMWYFRGRIYLVNSEQCLGLAALGVRVGMQV
jgi:hypothetical protein